MGFRLRFSWKINPLKGSFPPCRRGSRPHHWKRTARCAAPATARRQCSAWTVNRCWVYRQKWWVYRHKWWVYRQKCRVYLENWLTNWPIFDPQTVSKSWFATRTWRCMGISFWLMSRISGLTLVNGKLGGLMPFWLRGLSQHFGGRWTKTNPFGIKRNK